MSISTLTITQPDDWHTHLRDNAALDTTVPACAAQFARAIVMPNLTPAVSSVEAAIAYRDRILDALPESKHFEPLMTLYLTESMSPETINQAGKHEHIHACKLYPAGATTNSAEGVRDIKRIYPLLQAMQDNNLVLCIHGEVVNPEADIFDRESLFIEKTLRQLVKDFPNLRIVLEHITTKAAVDFIQSSPDNVAATITAHHLCLSRNDLLVDGIKPHYYCLPVVKRQTDRDALIRAATSGNPKFFLGTDSAPHAISQKESACGCAGIFTAPVAMNIYADIFERANALEKLEAFASFHGADFYQLPRNTAKIQLRKADFHVPNSMPYLNESIQPFMAGNTLNWQVVSDDRQ